MKSAKSIIRNILLFIILIVVTFYIIFRNYNIKETFDMILNANIFYIILAVFCMFFYFAAEALNNKWILESLGSKINFLQALKYPLIGFFFSGITPASGGGQPMQAYYMSRDGIPSSYATLSLIVQLISFHAITLVFGVFGFIFNYNLLSSGMIILFIVGTIVKSIVLALMYIGFRNKYAGKKIATFIFNILKKFKVKNLDKLEKTVDETIEDYNNGAWYIRKHIKIFFKSLSLMFLQVVVYFSLSYFIYRSFGLNYYNWMEMLSLQALLYLSVASIPLPGSVGVSEGAFLSIYEYIYGAEILASAMVISRGISFYLFMVIGSIVVLATTIFNMNNKKKNKQ